MNIPWQCWIRVGTLAAWAVGMGLAQASTCADLTSLVLAPSAVTSATEVAAGPYSPAGGAAREFPAFCRVLATLHPVEDSDIHVEIWLPPAALWNGKLLGTGNGGYLSNLSYGEMEGGLRNGYAVAGSDTGHTGGELAFGVGHPEKIHDWAWRAVHSMTEAAKLVIHGYYGRFPRYSYFSGCSTGGQQALTEAQRFPGDYDGILAGAPGHDRVRLTMAFLWSWLALNRDPHTALPVSKLPLLHDAVIAACDSLDGIKDGLLDDPRKCHFDPAALLCKGAAHAGCLTQPEVAAVRAVYDGPRNPRTGVPLHPGWIRGSEGSGTPADPGWTVYFAGKALPARLDFWRLWVFQDPGWDPRSFDFDRDLAYADAKMSFLVSKDADLSGFRRRNGKLLLYHGWADPSVPPLGTIDYLRRVEQKMGGAGDMSEFVRLFMIPGMGHCGGGAGPNRFDGLAALDAWVTSGQAPSRIVATHSTGGVVDRTRPLCPFPQIARWNGRGSRDDAAQFACVGPVEDNR